MRFTRGWKKERAAWAATTAGRSKPQGPTSTIETALLTWSFVQSLSAVAGQDVGVAGPGGGGQSALSMISEQAWVCSDDVCSRRELESDEPTELAKRQIWVAAKGEG